MTKSDDNNAMECRVGLAVAASVEPMPVGLAGGSRDGIDTAQGGEGSLGVEAGLLPAAMRRVAAVSGPMPKPSTRAGAAVRVSRWISASRSFISLPS